MNRFIFLLVIFAMCGLVSCDKLFTGGNIDEGTIVYKIEYLNNSKGKLNHVVYLLPEEMKLVFKENMSKQSIEGFLGAFTISGITNCGKGLRIGIVKVMSTNFIIREKFMGQN